MGMMVQPEVGAFKRATLPAYSFLITHPSTSRALLFDLGVRKDWENMALAIVSRIKASGPAVVISVTRDVAQTLQDHGTALDSIEGIIWSHYH